MFGNKRRIENLEDEIDILRPIIKQIENESLRNINRIVKLTDDLQVLRANFQDAQSRNMTSEWVISEKMEILNLLLDHLGLELKNSSTQLVKKNKDSNGKR